MWKPKSKVRNLILLFLAACGGPVLEPGTYKTHLIITATSDPWYSVGETSDTEWKLSEDEGAYKADLGNSTILEGKEHKNKVVFDLYRAPLFCLSDFVHLTLTLKPTESGFSGAAFESIQFCNYYNPDTGEERLVYWATDYSVTGTRN